MSRTRNNEYYEAWLQQLDEIRVLKAQVEHYEQATRALEEKSAADDKYKEEVRNRMVSMLQFFDQLDETPIHDFYQIKHAMNCIVYNRQVG